MTNYNNAKHLTKCFESVLSQTFKDFDLLVFDNNSTDAAPDIIAAYAALDSRVKTQYLPEGFAGIEVAASAWQYLNYQKYEYSITIGGHDVWNTTEHLQRLVESMEVNRAARKADNNGQIALVYSDTWQLNEAGDICGRYSDIKQTLSIPRPFIPQYVVSGVNSPEFFGLWNEEHRKKVPIRHMCAGFDHLVVMNVALYGGIIFEPRVQLMMRAPLPDDHLGKYGQRHLPAATLAAGPKDFVDQLEWCLHCVELATEHLTEPERESYRVCLSSSMVATYLMLRGTNLWAVPGAMEAFNRDPRLQEMMKGFGHATRMARDLIRSSVPPALPRKGP